jgi:uncharacterized protein (TIGR02246 family)
VKALISAIALGAVLAGPAFGEDAASIVQTLGQKWEKAYDAQNAMALAALYTKNAVLLPQGVDRPLTGEAAIRKYYEDAVKQPVNNMSIKATEGKITGPDVGYSAGTWSADIPGQMAVRRHTSREPSCPSSHVRDRIGSSRLTRGT